MVVAALLLLLAAHARAQETPRQPNRPIRLEILAARQRAHEREDLIRATGLQWRTDVGRWIEQPFSPDGDRLLIVSRQAYLFDAVNLDLLATMGGHDWILHATFLARGERILTHGRELTVRLFDGRTGDLIRMLGGESEIRALDVAPGGERFVIGENTGRITLHDALTGDAVRSHACGEAAIGSLTFDPSGTLVLVVDEDGRLGVWHASDGRWSELHRMQGASRRASFSRDGTSVLCLDGGTFRSWDATTGEPGSSIADCLAYADDGLTVAQRSGPRAIRLVDGVLGEVGAVVEIPAVDVQTQQADVTRVSFLTDSLLAVSAMGDHYLFDVKGNRLDTSRLSLKFSADGTRMLRIDVQGRGKQLLETASGKPLASFPDGNADFTHDGRWIVAVTERGAASLFDVETGAHRVDLEGRVSPLRSTYVFRDRSVLASGEASLFLWDATTGKRLSAIRDRCESPQVSVAISGTDRIAVLSGNAVTPVDLGTGKSPDRTTIDAVVDMQVAVPSLDGRRLLQPSAEANKVDLIDLASNEVVATVRGRHGPRSFTADSRHFYTMDGSEVLIWDRDGKEVGAISHPGSLDDVVMSRDGERVMTIGGDVTQIWHALTSTRLQSFHYWTNVWGATFSPDATTLIIHTDQGVDLCRLDAPRPAGARVQGKEMASGQCSWSAFNRDGTRGAFWIEPKLTKGPRQARRVILLDAHDGRVLATIETGSARSLFSNDGRRLFVGEKMFDADSGQRIAELPGSIPVPTWRIVDVQSGRSADLPESIPVLSWNPDLVALTQDASRFLVAADSGEMSVHSLEDGKQLLVLKGHLDRVKQAMFKGDQVVSLGSDATLRVFDARDGRLLLTRVAYDDGSSIAFTPSRHYLASGDAERWTQILIGSATYPLSCYARVLKDEKVVASWLAGKEVETPPLATPPQLELVSPVRERTQSETRQFAVVVRASDRAGVARFEVAQDGTAVPDEVINAATRLERGQREATLELPLAIPEPASETTLAIRALNLRGVLSRTKTLSISHEPPASDLYVLAIGVADYVDRRLELRFAVKDADDVLTAFQAQEGRLYRRVHTLRLVDGEVSTASLRKARAEFLRRAQASDTLIVFVAGHGVLTEGGEYYFLTREMSAADPYQGVDRETIESLVTWDKLSAHRRVLLLDSCHAGEKFRAGTRAAERGARVFTGEDTERMTRAAGSGLYILAASAEDRLAREADGNGLFTRAVLEGLRGEADRNANGDVEISELTAFVGTRVHELSGGGQTPTLPLVKGGEDFALARVRR